MGFGFSQTNLESIPPQNQASKFVISSKLQTCSLTPAAIAGATRKVVGHVMQPHGSLHVQLALDAEFFDAFAQRSARDAEHFGGVNLIVVRFNQSLNHEFALDGGNDFQFRVAPCDLKKLACERGGGVARAA